MDYWSEKPGVGVNIVDKLLNYTILTPRSVVEWVVLKNIGKGEILSNAWVYEMIAATAGKVTNRVRQIVIARNQRSLPAEQRAILDETLEKERMGMRELFTLLEDGLKGVADGSADGMVEGVNDGDGEEALLKGWGRRWLRVFRRKMAVEETWVLEMLAEGPREDEEAVENGNGVALVHNHMDEVT